MTADYYDIEDIMNIDYDFLRLDKNFTFNSKKDYDDYYTWDWNKYDDDEYEH